MTDNARLAEQFEADLWSILENEHELGLCSTRFRQMLQERGAMGTANELLKRSDLPPNTFTYLRNKNRLNLTLEYYVALPQYASLFTKEQIEIAKWRLENES